MRNRADHVRSTECRVPAQLGLLRHDSNACVTVNFGTWESLVAGVANAGGLRRLRKEVRAAGTRPPPPKTLGPKLTVSSKAVYKPMLGAYALPFPGECLDWSYQS